MGPFFLEHPLNYTFMRTDFQRECLDVMVLRQLKDQFSSTYDIFIDYEQVLNFCMGQTWPSLVIRMGNVLKGLNSNAVYR